MDNYAQGGTPTIGAQVVYRSNNPQTSPLADITMPTVADGLNLIWCDAGTITVLAYGANTKEYIDTAISNSNKWLGLNAVAFGTSLTYRSQTTGGFLQYLPAISGITFDNQGLGSSVIYDDGVHPSMMNKITSYTAYTGKDVVLLEGFVNDWVLQRPLGAYTDSTQTSVCGCVRLALNYIYSQLATATIFLILDCYGQDGNASTAKSNNLTQYEFYEEIAKVANSIGVHVIKLYEESGINEHTPQYLLDNIHPNALGAKQTAKVIWAEMRKWFPNVTD